MPSEDELEIVQKISYILTIFSYYICSLPVM